MLQHSPNNNNIMAEKKRRTCDMEACQSKLNWQHAKNWLLAKFIKHANRPTTPQDRKTSFSSTWYTYININITYSSDVFSKLLTLWIRWPQWQNPTVPKPHNATSYMNGSCMICHHVMVDDKRRCSGDWLLDDRTLIPVLHIKSTPQAKAWSPWLKTNRIQSLKYHVTHTVHKGKHLYPLWERQTCFYSPFQTWGKWLLAI